MKSSHIHPVFDRLISRTEKENLLGQHACALWFTGLSGSGKTTIAEGLEKELQKLGRITTVLDGDNIRSGINKNLGFSDEDRAENIRRIAEINRLFIATGIITINCFVSPKRDMRDLARNIIGADDFVEVYINTPLDVCEQRDVKGLYAKARKGEINDFTGVQDAYEPPHNPDIEINTANRTVEESVQEVLAHLLPIIQTSKE